jgi:hypothetical protein
LSGTNDSAEAVGVETGTKALPPTADEIALAKAEPAIAVDKRLAIDRAEREESLVEAGTPVADAGDNNSQPVGAGDATSSAQGVAQDAPITSTDALAQPAGAAELTNHPTRGNETHIAPIGNTEEQVSMTTLNADDDRAGVDLDTIEGQAQAMPVGGEAAVYEPGGDEDDDLIEGGEEYEEGDYDDELAESEAVEDGGAEAGEVEAGEVEAGEVEAGDEAVDEGEDDAGLGEGAEGIEGEDVYDEEEEEVAEDQGEDQDPYGVDGYVEGVIGGNEEYDPEAEAEAEGTFSVYWCMWKKLMR